MFNNVTLLGTNDFGVAVGTELAFIESTKIKAYPCGRRRARVQGAAENQYIPFDPEAKLNTEYNNRKYTSLNGFSSCYIQEWSNTFLKVVLGGYYFEIEIPSSTEFCTAFKTAITYYRTAQTNPSSSAVNDIYLNIRLERTPLYEGTGLSYDTLILRNQSDTDRALGFLDLPAVTADADTEDYYFSGLSVSAVPLTGTGAMVLNSSSTFNETVDQHQQIFSLKIGSFVSGAWVRNKKAFLPKIEHGSTQDSVKINTLELNSATTTVAVADEPGADPEDIQMSFPAIRLKEVASDKYQLQFFTNLQN